MKHLVSPSVSVITYRRVAVPHPPPTVTSQQFFSLISQVPVIGGGGALLFLAWGLFRRSLDVTLAALTAFVIVGVVAVPVFLNGDRRDSAIAAIVGLEAAAVVALVSLFCWYTTRRYPSYSAGAALVLGVLASVLVLRAFGM